MFHDMLVYLSGLRRVPGRVQGHRKSNIHTASNTMMIANTFDILVFMGSQH
jgi:hypothetical protein